MLLKAVHVRYFQSVLPLFSLPYMPPEMPNFARQFSGHVHDQQSLSALRNCSQTFPSQGCSCVIQTIATTKQVHCLFHSALGGLPLNKGGIRSQKYSSGGHHCLLHDTDLTVVITTGVVCGAVLDTTFLH